MSLTSTCLFNGALVRITEVLCRAAGTGAGAEEESRGDVLVLPGRGRFVKHLPGGARVLAEPTQALLFAAERPYRVSHPDDGGDDCLALDFAEAVRAEVLGEAAGVEKLGDGRLRPHAHLAPAAAAARALLWRRLRRGTATPLEAEETALALFATAAAGARGEPAGPRPRRRRARAWAERALAIRDLLLERPADPWRLAELARRVCTTPFHLARRFREETGMPLHQYHQRVRLARALDLLLDTRRSLSEVALDCGFASHSHFTAVFHRHVGVAPARVRAALGGAGARELGAQLLGPGQSAGPAPAQLLGLGHGARRSPA